MNASAPAALAAARMRPVRRATTVGLLIVKPAPQHSVLCVHSTGARPRMRHTSSIVVGCSVSSKAITSGGRVWRQP